MVHKKNLLTDLMIVAAMLIGAIIFFPYDAAAVYVNNYLVDFFCLVVITVLLLHYKHQHDFSIFDPIYLISFIYAFMYFITPIYDILTKTYYWFGYDMFSYGVKSGVIAFAGYLMFYAFYYMSFRTLSVRKNEARVTDTSAASEDANNHAIFIPVIVVMYILCFSANIFYLIHSGYTNILYIFSFGLFGKGMYAADTMDSIGFVAMFSYCLPTLVLLYWEYTQKKVSTLFLFIPMLMLQVTRGFRFLVVQIAISFVTYFYLGKRKNPKLLHIVLLFVLLMVPVIAMTIYRNDIRNGSGVSGVVTWEMISKAFDDAIWDNFRIYNNYYGLVNSVPKNYDYIYGQQMIIGTLAMAIPRAIWPNKVATKGGVDLDYIVGRRLSKTGQAYPGLGEYYYSFGIFGVLLLMAIYGLWMRYVKERYMYADDKGYRRILFAVVLGTNLQLLIRGYTPSNFWYLVFSLLPVFVISLIDNNVFRKGQLMWEES